MHRGCASDITNDRRTCIEVGQQCISCSGSACNNQPATTQSALRCIQCNNADVRCAWGHTSDEAANCPSAVVFPNVESCYTFTYADSTVTRGCTLDNQLCTAGDQRCRTCSGTSCNNQNVITQSCKVCRSDVTGQEACMTESFAGFNQQCGPIVKYEDRGCYSKREGSSLIMLFLHWMGIITPVWSTKYYHDYSKIALINPLLCTETGIQLDKIHKFIKLKR